MSGPFALALQISELSHFAALRSVYKPKEPILPSCLSKKFRSRMMIERNLRPSLVSPTYLRLYVGSSPPLEQAKKRAKANFIGSSIDRPGRKSKCQESEATWYLRQDDAQVLAQSLLRLPICREGYLFSANKAFLCCGLLSSAAPNAPHLLNYIIRNFGDLKNPDASRPSLLTVMQEMYRRMHNHQYSRGFMDTIYEMDAVLQNALLWMKRSSMLSGCLPFPTKSSGA